MFASWGVQVAEKKKTAAPQQTVEITTKIRSLSLMMNLSSLDENEPEMCKLRARGSNGSQRSQTVVHHDSSGYFVVREATVYYVLLS